MDSNIKFSVLMSIYAMEDPAYFDLALLSVWNDQSLKPNEIVIVKDGPLPELLNNIIDKYSEFAPIKTIQLQSNQGLSNALNVGLNFCKYDIVARMDTDDISMPLRFEKQIRFLSENPNVNVLGSYALTINSLGQVDRVLRVPCSNEEINKLIWTCPFIHPTVTFRKKSILNIGGYNPNSGIRQDDYELWFRCAKNKLVFANIEEPLLKYRFTENNIRKNTFRVGIHRLKVGFMGCRKLHCSFIAYVGITVPFIRSLLPYPLNIYFYNLLNKINPRNK